MCRPGSALLSASSNGLQGHGAWCSLAGRIETLLLSWGSSQPEAGGLGEPHCQGSFGGEEREQVGEASGVSCPEQRGTGSSCPPSPRKRGLWGPDRSLFLIRTSSPIRSQSWAWSKAPSCPRLSLGCWVQARGQEAGLVPRGTWLQPRRLRRCRQWSRAGNVPAPGGGHPMEWRWLKTLLGPWGPVVQTPRGPHLPVPQEPCVGAPASGKSQTLSSPASGGAQLSSHPVVQAWRREAWG